jgi:hypothetical protein
MLVYAYEIALISVGGTIIGTWVGYKLSLQLSIINARREANLRLITTFHRELADIYPYPINWPKDIDAFLRSKFTALNAAIGEFRHYLPVGDYDSFDNAWFKFYCSTGREVDIKNCQSYHQYIAFEDKPNFKETFKHNVDSLLIFAKKRQRKFLSIIR